MSEKINKEIYTKLATRIYDLDGEVYRVLGSSLGRTFTGNRDTTIRTLSMLMYTKRMDICFEVNLLLSVTWLVLSRMTVREAA